MSSVSGLLVENNFGIYAASLNGEDIVTADSVTTFTNKTTLDSSNETAATFLYSGGKTNLINVKDAPIPGAGQVLTATGPNTAVWQTPAAPPAPGPAADLWSGGNTNVINVGGAQNPVAGEVLTAVGPNACEWDPLPPFFPSEEKLVAGAVTTAGAPAAPIVNIPLAQGDGAYHIRGAINSYSTSGTYDQRGFTPLGIVRVIGGVITQIDFNLAGTGGTWSVNPVGSGVGTNTLTLSAGDATHDIVWTSWISTLYAP